MSRSAQEIFFLISHHMGVVSKLQKHLHEMSRYAQKYHASSHSSHKDGGGDGGSSTKTHFATNCMKCANLHRKIMCLTPLHRGGVGVQTIKTLS